MIENYELWLDGDDGTRLKTLDNVGPFSYAMVAHDVGVCSLLLPDGFDTTLLDCDRRIEIWRAPTGGALQLERVYMLRKLVYQTNDKGRQSIQVTGLDGNYFLAGRIVGYASGSTQSTQTGPADDILKQIVRDNLGASAAAARQISALSVQANLGGGPTITKSFAYREVLKALQDIVDAAWAAGTKAWFDVAPVTPTMWEFQTRTGQLGQDHTYPNGVNPVMLSIELGNLRDAMLEQDWSQEVTYVYAGGQGEGSGRQVIEVQDAARLGRSAFGRREAFKDARNESTTNGVTAAANNALADGRPRLRFSGSIADTEGTRYGLHWRFGDKVTAVYAGQQFDCVVRAVKVSVDGNGKETVEAKLETLE